MMNRVRNRNLLSKLMSVKTVNSCLCVRLGFVAVFIFQMLPDHNKCFRQLQFITSFMQCIV